MYREHQIGGKTFRRLGCLGQSLTGDLRDRNSAAWDSKSCPPSQQFSCTPPIKFILRIQEEKLAGTKADLRVRDSSGWVVLADQAQRQGS